MFSILKVIFVVACWHIFNTQCKVIATRIKADIKSSSLERFPRAVLLLAISYVGNSLKKGGSSPAAPFLVQFEGKYLQCVKDPNPALVSISIDLSLL